MVTCTSDKLVNGGYYKDGQVFPEIEMVNKNMEDAKALFDCCGESYKGVTLVMFLAKGGHFALRFYHCQDLFRDECSHPACMVLFQMQYRSKMGNFVEQLLFE